MKEEALRGEVVASPASAAVSSSASVVSLATSSASETASKLTRPLLLESERARVERELWGWPRRALRVARPAPQRTLDVAAVQERVHRVQPRLSVSSREGNRPQPRSLPRTCHRPQLNSRRRQTCRRGPAVSNWIVYVLGVGPSIKPHWHCVAEFVDVLGGHPG